MSLAGPTPDPVPVPAERRRDGALGEHAFRRPSLRWLLLLAVLLPLVLLAQRVTRSVVGEGVLAPFAGSLGVQAWGLIVGIAAATSIALAGRQVPRPAAIVLAVTWLIPTAVVGLHTDLRALDADPDLTVVVGAVAAAFVMAVALVGWSLRLSVRLTLLVIAGVLGGAMGAATTGALAGRGSGGPSAARTGRELAMVGPLVVLLPVLLVALVAALAVQVLPEDAGGVFHALALGEVTGTDVSVALPAHLPGLRLAVVVPTLVALALAARAADVTGSASVGRRRALGDWGQLVIGAGVLSGCVLVGTAAAATGGPIEIRAPVGEAVIAAAFVAIGLHAPVRATGPWSPKLVLTVGIGAVWLVIVSLIAALAVSGRH